MFNGDENTGIFAKADANNSGYNYRKYWKYCNGGRFSFVVKS